MTLREDYSDLVSICEREDEYYQMPSKILRLREVLRRWSKEGRQLRDLGKVYQHPIREVWSVREYTWSQQGARQSPDEWDALKASMKTKGWDPKYPAIIQVGRNGVMKVGEGNHRLAVAAELGMTRVPIRFGEFYEAVHKEKQSLRYQMRAMERSRDPELRRIAAASKRRSKEEKRRGDKRKREKADTEARAKADRDRKSDERNAKMSPEQRKSRDRDMDDIMKLLRL